MTGARTPREGIDRAAAAYVACLAACAQMTPREQAEAAHHATSTFTVDELEDRIRARRGLSAVERRSA